MDICVLKEKTFNNIYKITSVIPRRNVDGIVPNLDCNVASTPRRFAHDAVWANLLGVRALQCSSASWASRERVLRIEHVWFFGSILRCFDLVSTASCLNTWCAEICVWGETQKSQWGAGLESHDTSYKVEYGYITWSEEVEAHLITSWQ